MINRKRVPACRALGPACRGAREYLAANADEDGSIHFFDDIYGYDAEMDKVLAKGPPYPIKPEPVVPKTKAGDTL